MKELKRKRNGEGKGERGVKNSEGEEAVKQRSLDEEQQGNGPAVHAAAMSLKKRQQKKEGVRESRKKEKIRYWDHLSVGDSR